MQRDTDFIYEAIAKVEELTGISIEFDSTRPNCDGLIRIKETEFAVEAKSAVKETLEGFFVYKLTNWCKAPLQQGCTAPLRLNKLPYFQLNQRTF